ncbi:MAG: pilus assembly protein [Anaerolineales bacterium]|nr:pilus assembly protein [Anaerolineales bacterium]
MYGTNHKDRKESGQSLVEFAFGLVMLLILVVGIVDGSRALFTYLAMRDAAQEGALFGSTVPYIMVSGNRQTNPEISARTLESSETVSDLSGEITVTVEFIDRDGISFDAADQQPCPGDAIKVWVRFPNFKLTMPLIGGLIGADSDYTVPITAWVSDTILTPPCP